MKFALLPAVLIFLLAFPASAADEATAKMPEAHFAIFDKYCLECHDSLTEEGGVNLDDLSFKIDSVASAELWQKVLNSLNSGEMPPEDEPQLSDKEKTGFLDDLSHELVAAREILSDSGGMITMRRLNRREYENTIYDLLGVRIDAEDLPADTNSDGFDTTGASLFFSSDQFEQYLKLAHNALDKTFLLSKEAPKVMSFERESEPSINKFFEKQSTKLKSNYDKAQEWRAVAKEKPPKAFGFIDENDVAFHERLYNQQYATYRQYLDRPESKTGILLYRLFNGAVLDTVNVSPKWPAGEYTLKVRVAALEGAPSHERFLEYGIKTANGRAGELDLLGCVEVTGTMADPQILEIPVTVEKTGSRSYGLRQRQHNNRDAARADFLKAQVKNKVGPPPALWIDRIEISGPHFETWPPRGVTDLFFKGREWWKRPDEDAYAREIIERFAARAFRIKEPSPAYLEKLYELYAKGKSDGKKLHEAIREPLATILASPGFLYLIEPVPASGEGRNSPSSTKREPKRKLTDPELAVRLSYFLWSSPPDKALYDVARAGELSDPAKLAAQTNRMLKDPRSDAFISSFAHQWLHMERLDFFQFDFRQFPEFDDSVKAAARQEVYETMRSVINERRPLKDLLKTDHVVVNNLLADYYGLEGVEGGEFRKVSLPADSPRGGLLGMAATMAMGSDGNRSSPVERGAWVMRKLLDDPPPPAPANVPQLSRLQGKLLSPRELQNAHMEEAQCAQCHRKIDPIGYGLENFDAAGKWRETMILTQAGRKKKAKLRKTIDIDAHGQLPGGAAFDDFAGLRDAIANQGSAFERGFIEALIEYALGRPYGFSDESLREKLLKRARAKNGEMREFILALVQSKPFRTKK
ncbi:MAG: DUF1592 domain-containing protein [Verrucomicrobiales bacterium]|nr:DUF1592 domain-containing protein [Verrucomicrobiales bacterium]